MYQKTLVLGFACIMHRSSLPPVSVSCTSFFRVANPKKPHNIEHAKAVKPCWGLLMLVRGVFQRHPSTSDPSYLHQRSILPTSSSRSIFQTMFWPLFFQTMLGPLFFQTMLGPLVEVRRSQTTACIDRSRIGR
jgi:hypothetical protein